MKAQRGILEVIAIYEHNSSFQWKQLKYHCPETAEEKTVHV